MEKAREFEDEESIAIPANHVLSILQDPNKSKEVVENLHRTGFSRDEIGVFMGAEGVAKLDSASGEKGFLAKLTTSGIDMGDRDSDYIKQYRNAVLKGKAVIAVATKNQEAKDRAKQILKAGGGSFITFFGRFSTELLDL
jgi:hypothetical protein